MAFARGEMRKKSGILACGMPMSRKCAGKIGSLQFQTATRSADWMTANSTPRSLSSCSNDTPGCSTSNVSNLAEVSLVSSSDPRSSWDSWRFNTEGRAEKKKFTPAMRTKKAATVVNNNEKPNCLDSSKLTRGPLAPPTLLSASRRARLTATRVGLEVRWMMVSEALLIKVSAKPWRRRKKNDASRKRTQLLRYGSPATTRSAAHSTHRPKVMS